MVRIRFPPAASPLRTRLSGAHPTMTVYLLPTCFRRRVLSTSMLERLTAGF